MSERAPLPATSPNDAARPRRNPTVRQRRAALTVDEASAGLLTRRLSVAAPDVVFVKGIIEASEGLAVIFAERGGELTIAAPREREADLAELLSDLARELGGTVDGPPAPEAPSAGAVDDRL